MHLREFSAFVLGISLFFSPLSASAKTWDFLFEDLSWTTEGTVTGNDELSFETSLVKIETPSGYFDYLFTDLSWPDAQGLVGVGSGEGSSGFETTPSSGVFNYLVEDIGWPQDSAASLVSGF